MVKEISVTQPVSSTKTQKSDVFEYFPKRGKKKVSILFLKRGEGEAWKTNQQRDRIFGAVWSSWEADHPHLDDSGPSLLKKTVIELHGFVGEEGNYQYSYREDGKLVNKAITLQADGSLQQVSESVDGSEENSPIRTPTFHRVRELSLRQFEQVGATNSIIAFLKALIDLLFTPFYYIYSLFAERTEQQRFAEMLVPIEQHDRVDGVDHNAVLSQVQFMGNLLATEIPGDYSKALGLSPATEHTLFFQGKYRPCEDCGDHYKIWIDGAKRVFKESGLEEVWENQPAVEIQFDKTDPILRNFPNHPKREVSYATSQRVDVCVKFDGEKGEWLTLPKTHPLIRSAKPSYQTDVLTEKERDPGIKSSAQEAPRIFSEAYQLGSEMYLALNSGNKTKIERSIANLVQRFADLPKSRHLLIPIGQGEGRNYSPHFLIFVQIDDKTVILKHLSFPSTSSAKEKKSLVRTYDMSACFADNVEYRKLARTLFYNQPYSRKKDAKEFKRKGPAVEDRSLGALFLKFGVELPQQTHKYKASRDPVKAIFAVIKELKLEEHPRLPSEEHRLEILISSKARFYSTYVNHLISYYQANETKLSASDRAHALNGICWYANQVRHYMENEVGADAALEISSHLIEFVEKKLAELEGTKELEKKDISNLKSSVALFQATLAQPLSSVMKRENTTKKVDVTRVGIPEWAIVENLRAKLNQTIITQCDKTQAHQYISKLIDKASEHIQNKNPLAAKSLMIGVMSILPPPEYPASAQNFWNALDEHELGVWIHTLSLLAERAFEGSLQSGTYPLKPHEVFEFNVVVPLIQRYLLERKIPFAIKRISGRDGILKAYNNRADLKNRVDQSRRNFIAIREEEIEKEVREDLQRTWIAEDEADLRAMNDHNERVRRYRQQLADYEREISKKRDKNTWYNTPRKPTEPIPPIIRSPEVKEADRGKQFLKRFESAKRGDAFIIELKGVDVDQLGDRWDHLMKKSARFQAVMGNFAMIIGIPKKDYAYYIGDLGWINQTFDEREDSIWLMRQDCSVLVGSSPAFEKRFAACKKVFQKLARQQEPSANIAANFIIGYDNLGRGAQVGKSVYKNLLNNVYQRHAGFFQTGEGSHRLAPDELCDIRKVDSMRKVLARPAQYLASFVSGIDASSPEALQSQFNVMKRIYLVVGSGYESGEKYKAGFFTLSDNPTKANLLLSISTDKESIPTHYDRAKYIGQIEPRAALMKFGGDGERKAVAEANQKENRLYKELDGFESLVFMMSNLSKSGSKERELELSYLSVTQCMHMIYQYPEKLEIPKVQHNIYKTLFQQGLVSRHLRKNPEFFLEFGRVLNEVCHHLQQKEDVHRASELFIREICERIRRHAFALNEELKELYPGHDWAQEISKALPSYRKEDFLTLCRSKLSEPDQKVYATFALCYYCHKFSDGRNENPDQFPSTKDYDAWRDVLFSFYILRKSPLELGHSGLQEELIAKVQKDLLPRISAAFASTDPRCRNTILEQVSNRSGNWKVGKQPYTYFLEDGDRIFTVDILSGKGFKDVIAKGERCKLPEQIRSNESYKFLFKSMDPLTTSDVGLDGMVDYIWKDDREVQFTFRYKIENKDLQISQEVNGDKYVFQMIELDEHIVTKGIGYFFRTKNKNLEDLLKSKGMWIRVDAQERLDTSQILIAQHGWNLEKDPIRLIVDKKDIKGATVGTGKELKWVCSALKSLDTKLLSFRTDNGLLLLSKNKKTIDEIRLPADPITKEQLILKKSAKEDLWVVDGREDWVWQLTDTKIYEQRFGRQWREYILPLKNRHTGEEEMWIFPHLVLGGNKRWIEPKFIKTSKDLIDIIDLTMSQNSGGLEGVNVHLRMFVSALESFFSGADNLLETLNATFGSQVDEETRKKFFPFIKNLTAPRAIRYRIDRRSETSSHSGFYYLATVAALKGDWGCASRYLEMVLENGNSTLEDIKQLQSLLFIFFFVEQSTDALFAPKGHFEVAFRAKLAATLCSLQVRFMSQHGIDIFADLRDNKIKADLGKLIGAHYYMDYRKGLKANYQTLKDHGLLLTKREESILTSNLETMGLALAAAAAEKKPKTPKEEPLKAIQLEIPDPQNVQDMLEQMVRFIAPYGVWSIHDLHKEEGSYPKWETVLANFWCYWEWIYRNDLSVEDISFLLREVPSKGDRSEIDLEQAVDTARKLLLLFWHYKDAKQKRHKEHMTEHYRTEELLLREIKMKRLEMPDNAYRQSKTARLSEEAIENPGIFNISYSYGYKLYGLIFQFLMNSEHIEVIGGVAHTRGTKHEFIKSSFELLNTFLLDANAIERERGFVIHQDHIGPYQKERLSIDDVSEDDLSQKIRAKYLEKLLLRFSRDIPTLSRVTTAPDSELGKTIALGFGAFLEMPDFDLAWSQIKRLMTKIEHDSCGVISTRMNASALTKLRGDLLRIHLGYAQKAGYPTSAAPILEKAKYEPVEVKITGERPVWSKYFANSLMYWDSNKKSWETREKSIWDKQKESAKAYLNPESAQSKQEEHELEQSCYALDVAAEDLKKRTGSSFIVDELDSVFKEIKTCIKALGEEDKVLRERILDFTRIHAQELNLMHLFVDRTRFTEEQIIQAVIHLYKYGQLGLLDDEDLQIYFANLITDSLLVTTELQQYKKAKETCKQMAVVRARIETRIPESITGNDRIYARQNIANYAIDWLFHSADLKRYLEEGSNRLRYTKEIEGRHFLKDQKFTRRYLTSDREHEWICRDKAIEALQNMLKDLREGETKGEPIRFIKAKMGTGKSDFIFPEAIDLMIQEGYEPIMITTDELVDQLNVSMGGKGFLFKFSIDFGLDKVYARELGELGPDKKELRWKELTQAENIEAHLLNLLHTLENLKDEKKAILTSPSQLSALRNKRVQLQSILSILEPGSDRNTIFRQLEIIKQIENQIKKRFALVDEDANYHVGIEYNYAVGDPGTVDPIRFDMAERIIRTISANHPHLWDLIINNNLRAINKVDVEFREVVRDLFHDTDFWMEIGWKKEVDWSQIDEEEFIDFILGKQEALPRLKGEGAGSMPKWNIKLSYEQQTHKCYLAALKTFFSKTIEAVKGVNPRLERGISSFNGVTTVPYSDGQEKEGVLYGEESEHILHSVFNLLGMDCNISEEFFNQKIKDLGGLDSKISEWYPETWKMWAGNIATILDRRGYASKYHAFRLDKELALERFQFCRYVMLETNLDKVYRSQITFNSQDLGIGTARPRLASGTGKRFALNLSDYLTEKTQPVDTILAETILCLRLDRPIETFAGTPLEHIQKKSQDPKCQAILNYDYDVGEPEKVAAKLRSEVSRQMVYRKKEDQQLAKKIWNPGVHYFPMSYDPSSLSDEALFLFFRADALGVHFHMQRGGGRYCEAMFGIGNLEDPIAQLLWRARHIDLGHDIHMSCTPEAKKQIRLALRLKENETVTNGHALLYFKLNTLGEESIKNVKAIIFKEKGILKHHLDIEARKGYDLTDIHSGTKVLEELEGKAVFAALRDLYISDTRSRWAREYEAHQTQDPIQFVKGICEEEIKNIHLLRESFKNKVRAICEAHKGNETLFILSPSSSSGGFLSFLAPNQLGWVEQLADANLKTEEFEEKLAAKLEKEMSSATSEQKAFTREILRKYFGILIGFQLARADLEKELENLKTPEYKEYLNNNLPEKIAVEQGEGMRSEQKIQQQMQQKQEQEQKKLERNLTPAFGDKPTGAIDYECFKSFATGKRAVTRSSQGNEWLSNGNVLPLQMALSQYHDTLFDCPGFLPKDDFEDVYISQRAWQLIHKMGQAGAPAVEILVYQDNNKYSTVIVTPAEHEETLAVALIAERACEEVMGDGFSKIEQPVWEAVKGELGKMMPSFRSMILNLVDSNQVAIKKILQKFITNPDFEGAWIKLKKEVAKIPAFQQWMARIDPALNDRKENIGAIHRKFREQMLEIDAEKEKEKEGEVDNRTTVALFALSNQNFSRMIMDKVKAPDQENEGFIQKMVMNKLFLNWDQFSLVEFDYLTRYVQESTHAFRLENTLNRQRAAHTSDLMKRIREKDPLLIRAIVMRKLNENHLIFNGDEASDLEEWILSLSDIEFDIEKNRLARIGASDSKSLIENKRRGLKKFDPRAV